MHALAKHFDKTLYNLTAPYLDGIAPYLVSRLVTEPGCLAEFCSFLSRSQSDFINLTLKYSLPRLFAEENAKVLDIVSRTVRAETEKRKNIGLLVLDQAHYILAYLFMLPGVSQTPKALRFVLKCLRESANDPDGVSIRAVVKSCLLFLLTEIVTYLGDEDPEVVDRVSSSLII